MAFTESFIVRERKREIGRLEKRKADVMKRIADMRDAVTLLEQQIAEHHAEIKRVNAIPAPEKAK